MNSNSPSSIHFHKMKFVRNHSLSSDIFSLRDKIFNDENLQLRMALIRNRIPPTNNKKEIELNHQILNSRVSSRRKVTQVNYNKMDYDNEKLLNKIKGIFTRARTPKRVDSPSAKVAERRKMNIINSNQEKRRLYNKSIKAQNTSYYDKLKRIHSPLSKKKLDPEFEKHEKYSFNASNLRGFSKGVNDRLERMITPYLPRISPKNSNGFTRNNSGTRSPTMANPKISGIGKMNTSLKITTSNSNMKNKTQKNIKTYSVGVSNYGYKALYS